MNTHIYYWQGPVSVSPYTELSRSTKLPRGRRAAVLNLGLPQTRLSTRCTDRAKQLLADDETDGLEDCVADYIDIDCRSSLNPVNSR
jgi:hypothetical protein